MGICFLGDSSVTISAQLDFQPTTLEHVKTDKTDLLACYGVSFTEDSSILLSCGREIHVHDSTNLRSKTTAVMGEGEIVTAAVMVGDTVLTK